MQLFLKVGLGLALLLLPAWHDGSAQDQPADAAEQRRREVLDRVNRARRLREYGYPLLARTQLDAGRKLEPASRELLVEYVRLFTLSSATAEETASPVAALLELYPNDYEACLEIARYLFQATETPPPPMTRLPEQLKASLERLEAEMVVYRELARYIAEPKGELPAVAAARRPALSLAYLARCVKVMPGAAECNFLAASELFFRARAFQGWSKGDEALRPFAAAGQELYALAEPLFRSCAGSATYGPGAEIYLLDLMTQLGRFEDARRQAVAAEQLNPSSLRIADLLALIAETTSDVELLVSALQKRHAVMRDEATEFTMRAARRVEASKWPFIRWRQFSQAESMDEPARRRGAIALVLQEVPEYAELQLLDALTCIELARQAGDRAAAARSLEDALAALDRCKELAADFSLWHTQRGLVLWLLTRYAEAADNYEAAARLNPNDSESRGYAIAARDIAAGLYTSTDYDAYVQLKEAGDFRDKRDELSAITARSPGFLMALIALAEVCQVLGDFPRAFDAAIRAYKLAPENFNVVDTAASAALESGRYKDASDWYQRLLELSPSRDESRRMLSISRDLASGSESRRKAWEYWRQAQRPVEGEAGRRLKLEEAVKLDSTLPEALIDLAVLERALNPDRSGQLLEAALKNSRDEFTRAAALRERGRLLAGARMYERAVDDFLLAYNTVRGDGADLLLAAMTLTQQGKHADASSAMRKLFSEVPGTPLLRPRNRDIHALDVEPVRSEQSRKIGPEYSVGQKLKFSTELTVRGEGGGQSESRLTLEFESTVEVVETPQQGGLWQLRMTFGQPPSPEFAQLSLISLDLHISPWFGLVREPNTGILDHVVEPAVQAIVEAFTCGVGDAPILPPLLWKNTMTKGPPHFGGDDSIEAAYLRQALGQELLVERTAFAGRQIGDNTDPFQTELTFTRRLLAGVRLAGPRQSILETGFEISRHELTRGRDDVIFSYLSVTLKAK